MPLVEQEPLILPKHLGSSPVFSEFRVIRSLVLCVMFCRSLFVLFLLAIELSVLLRFTDSDYLFGVFKLFLDTIRSKIWFNSLFFILFVHTMYNPIHL